MSNYFLNKIYLSLRLMLIGEKCFSHKTMAIDCLGKL